MNNRKLINSAITKFSHFQDKKYQYYFCQIKGNDTIVLENNGIHHISAYFESTIYTGIKSFYDEITISDKCFKNRKVGIYAEQIVARQVDPTYNSEIILSNIPNSAGYFKYPIDWMIYPLFFQDKGRMFNADFFKELVNETPDTFPDPYITKIDTLFSKPVLKKSSLRNLHLYFTDSNSRRINLKWRHKINDSLLTKLFEYEFFFTINTRDTLVVSFEIVNKSKNSKQIYKLKNLQDITSNDYESFYNRLLRKFPEEEMPKYIERTNRNQINTSFIGNGNKSLHFKLPDFTGITYKNTIFSLSKATTKYVLLFYWNSEVINNISKTDSLLKFISKYPEIFTIIGINNYAESNEKISEIHKKMNWNFETIPSKLIPTLDCYKDEVPAVSLVELNNSKISTICTVCQKPDKDIWSFLLNDLGLK